MDSPEPKNRDDPKKKPASQQKNKKKQKQPLPKDQQEPQAADSSEPAEASDEEKSLKQRKQRDREAHQQRKREKQEKKLSDFVDLRFEEIWTAMTSGDEEGCKQFGTTVEGAKKIIARGRDVMKKEFHEHMRSVWEKQGLIDPLPKDSLLGNVCCILFMLGFFVLMVYSKLNQEAVHLLGFDANHNFTVAAAHPGLLRSPPADPGSLQPRDQAAVPQAGRPVPPGPGARRSFEAAVPEDHRSELGARRPGQKVALRQLLRPGQLQKLHPLENSHADRAELRPAGGQEPRSVGRAGLRPRLFDLPLVRRLLGRHGLQVPFPEVRPRGPADAAETRPPTALPAARVPLHLRLPPVDRAGLRGLQTRPRHQPRAAADHQRHRPGQSAAAESGRVQRAARAAPARDDAGVPEQERLRRPPLPLRVARDEQGALRLDAGRETRAGAPVPAPEAPEQKAASVRPGPRGRLPGRPAVRSRRVRLRAVPRALEQTQVPRPADALRLEPRPPLSRARRPRRRAPGPPLPRAARPRHRSPRKPRPARVLRLGLDPYAPLTAAKAFDNLTVARASQETQPELYQFIVYLAQQAGSALQDSVLAYHPQSEKLVLVEAAKQRLQMDGIEGLAELSLDRVHRFGGYVTERYTHLKHFHDLLREEDFSLLKVDSPHQLVLGYVWAELLGGWTLGLLGIFAATALVRQIARMRKTAMLFYSLASAGKVCFYVWVYLSRFEVKNQQA